MSLDISLVDEFSPARQAALLEPESAFLALYSNRGCQFGFVAAHHTINPNSATFRAIDAAVQRVRPQVVLLEGVPSIEGYDPPQMLKSLATPRAPGANSWDMGEGAYAAAQALSAQARILGGEPSDALLFKHLASLGFQDQDIFFSSLLAPLQQDKDAAIFRSVQTQAFSAAFETWSELLCPHRSLEAVYQQSAFERWCRNCMGRNVFDESDFLRFGDPGRDGFPAAVSRSANRLRDYHLLELVQCMLSRHQRVVAVFGASHLSNLWRGFQALLGPPVIVTP